MKYKITIEKVSTERQTTEEWHELYSDESFDKIREEDPKAKQNGYVTKVADVEVKETVLTQTKEGEVDLMAVIQAFNMSLPQQIGMKPPTIDIQNAEPR